MESEDAQKSNILKTLRERISTKNKQLVCPVCSYEKFFSAQGYTSRSQNYKKDQLGPSAMKIPSITVICNNCGYILDFSLGILGFLEDDNGK